MQNELCGPDLLDLPPVERVPREHTDAHLPAPDAVHASAGEGQRVLHLPQADRLLEFQHRACTMHCLGGAAGSCALNVCAAHGSSHSVVSLLHLLRHQQRRPARLPAPHLPWSQVSVPSFVFATPGARRRLACYPRAHARPCMYTAL